MMENTPLVVEPRGRHLIIEMHGATRLQDVVGAESAFRRAVTAAGATLLSIELSDFKTPDMTTAGFSGTATLAESHMSVHTWPEIDYAALDIFMCGDANPEAALEVLKAHFAPHEIDVLTLQRNGRRGAPLLQQLENL
jgi:S-adenosylmethionine decarboxylase